jgi:hypothetical protein
MTGGQPGFFYGLFLRGSLKVVTPATPGSDPEQVRGLEIDPPQIENPFLDPGFRSDFQGSLIRPVKPSARSDENGMEQLLPHHG